MDRRGQSFAVFKLLIGAILALMIMVIILGAIAYLDQIKIIVDEQRFFAALNDAASQPNGRVLLVENIYLDHTRYSRKTLSEKMAIGEDCIELDAQRNEIFVLEDDYIEITKRYSASVYVMCGASAAYPDDCGFGCLISFGKEIE